MEIKLEREEVYFKPNLPRTSTLQLLQLFQIDGGVIWRQSNPVRSSSFSAPTHKPARTGGGALLALMGHSKGRERESAPH